MKRLVRHAATAAMVWLLASAALAESSRSPVLLITVDTLRADHARGPGFERLAEAGVRFPFALAPSPLTLPSHASILTGLFPFRHGARDNVGFALADEHRTLAEYLSAFGYTTGAFLSSAVLDLSGGLAQGFQHYDMDLKGRPERAAAETLSRALSWISGRTDQPFFCWIHLYDPHLPYLPPDGYEASYQGEAQYVADQLEAFWKELEGLGLFDRALIVLTSDHGEALGEHGEPSHGFFLYEEVLRVPLVVKLPAQDSQTVKPGPARLIDIPATIRHALRLPAPFESDGRSLLGPARPGASVNYAETLMPRLQFRWSSLRSFRKGHLKYIHAPKPELYDLEQDPEEGENLFGAKQALGAAMRREFLDWLSRRSPPQPASSRQPRIGASRLEALAALGYTRLASESPPDLDLTRPDPKDKVEVYGEYLKAMADAEEGRVEESNRRLELIVASDPSFFQGHFLLGVNKGKAGHYLESVQHLRRCLEIAPGFTLAENKLVLAYDRSGLGEKAEQLLQEQLRRDPDNYLARHNWAVRLQRRGETAEAVRQEKRALEINPDYAEGWSALGALYLFQDEPEQAVEALSKAIDLRPFAPAYYNLHLAHSKLGEKEKASEALRQACKLDRRYCQK